MKLSLKRAITGVTALAIAGGALVATAGAASAATPTFEPDPNAVGTLAFYDAAGNQITSGSLDAKPMATYYAASGGATPNSTAPGNTRATVYFAIPQDGVNSQLWSQDPYSASTQFGSSFSASYPAPLTGSPNAIAKGTSGDLSINDELGMWTLGSTQNPNVVQMRVATGNTAEFYRADIKIDTATNTWTQVFPAVATPDATSVSASYSPASPAPSSTTSVTVTGTVSDTTTPATIPTGSVQLFNGTTAIGSSATVGANGSYTLTAPVAQGGSYNFSVHYTHTGNFADSASPATAYSVTGPAVATTTTVSGANTDLAAGATRDFTATVSPSTATGTVQFKDNGTNYGAAVAVSGGTAVLHYTAGSTAGSHTITATFTPSGNFTSSSDTTGVTFNTLAPTNPTDEQNVVVTVPSGSLTISSPYTPQNPLNLGNLVLASDGTHYTAAGALFDSLTVADTNPGDHWSATVWTSDFTGLTGAAVGTSFSGSSLTFGALTATPVAPLTASDVVTAPAGLTGFANAAANAKEIAHSVNATTGTVSIKGNLGLTNVPTTVKTGTYTATLTFTAIPTA